MYRYIALFRGINVGGQHLVPMKALVEILGELGCERIRTYIQSGNVVFDSTERERDRIAQAIRSRILDSFQFEPIVVLLDAGELQAAILNNPFSTENGKALHFFFLNAPPLEPDMAALKDCRSGSEDFHLDDKVFYLYAPDGVGRSKLAARAERHLGVPTTARNWNTVRKLMDLVQSAP